MSRGSRVNNHDHRGEKNPAFRHGQSKTPEYKVWSDIKSRCLNPNNKEYHCYGGRGITVCSRWRNDFVNFISDMGKRPVGYTLERVEVNGNYSPSNCKWVPSNQQPWNKQRSLRAEFKGTMQPVIHIAKAIGMSYMTLRHKLFVQKININNVLQELQ